MCAKQTMRFIAVDQPGDPEVMHIAEGPLPKVGPSDAKTEATRQGRLETAIEWIAERKSRNWKYEKC